jgi:hypothetical protein
MNFAISTSSCVGTDPLPALYIEDESQSVEMDMCRELLVCRR